MRLTEPGQFATTAPTYTLTVYPSDEFNRAYNTNGPTIAAIASITAILVTSVVFLLYDFLVHRDLSAKGDLLAARRQFMRFVSVSIETDRLYVQFSCVTRSEKNTHELTLWPFLFSILFTIIA